MKTKIRSIVSVRSGYGSDRTQNNSIRSRWFALGLGGFLFVSVFALLSSSAQAGCSQYDVSGEWTIFQGSYTIPLALSQNGKTVSGTATQVSRIKGVLVVHGSVTGAVEGNSFDVQINWAGGGAGVYRGTINQYGKLFGTTYDKNNRGSTASWNSPHTFTCADAAPVNPKPETKSASAAADDWLEQERRKRKTATQPTPSASNRPRGFINGLELATPTPTPEADESASDDQHKKKKKKHHHHHHDDDENQGND